MSRLTHPNSPPDSRFELAGALAFLLLAFFASVSLNLRLTSGWDRLVAGTRESGENARRVDPRLYKVLSLGQVPAAVDWLWLRILTDADLSKVEKGTHPLAYRQLEAATDLDPAFFEAYFMGANLLAVIRDDGPGALSILKKGEEFRLRQLPSYPDRFRENAWRNPWKIPLMMGYTYLFELSDIRNAAASFTTASEIPGSPPYLRILARRFAQPGGEYEVGLQLLRFMINAATDEAYRTQLESKEASLKVGKLLRDLNESFSIFVRTKARELPAAETERQALWERFRRETQVPARDPWGGELKLDAQGRVVTSTPHDRVLGLD